MLRRKETLFYRSFYKVPSQTGDVTDTAGGLHNSLFSLFLAGRVVILRVPFHGNQEGDPRVSSSASP